MNKKFSIFLMSIIGAGALLNSCVDLDSDKYFEDRKTLESVFSEKTQSEEWLAYAYSFLKGVNAEVGTKGGTGGGGGAFNPFCFDDDMYYGDRDNIYGDSKDGNFASYNAFHEGRYDENVGQDAWYNCYKGIFQASVFIHNIYRNKEMTPEQIEDYRGQARFVRAYYYWLLLRKYGPVPIVPDDGIDYTQSYDDIATPRSTYEEVANYISSEMIQAAKEIKYTKRDEGNAARPTKGACLATRAIAYIYAASPLANGQLANGSHPAGVTDAAAKQLVNYDGTPLLTMQYDEAKWARAAAACKDVMNLGVYDLYHASYRNSATDDAPVTITPPDDGNFSTKNWPNGWKDIDPYLSYRSLFDGVVNAAENPELIFSRVSNISTSDNEFGIGALVVHEMPVSLGGWNTHGLTQKMVDAYYMNDGTDVPGKDSEMNGGDGSERVTGWTTRADIRNGLYPELSASVSKGGINVSLQYVKREPRFYASVAFNGSVWECLGDPSVAKRNKQIFYYRAGGNGYLNAFSYLRTGIGCRKWYNPYDYISNTSDRYSTIREKVETAIRYADILLMYAEALNELNGTYQIASWDGSTTYTIGRDVEEMKKGINPVRIRAGLPDYTSAEYSDKDVLRTKIKRERMIEFMGEGKRYFDLRRWMDAPIEESKRVYGLNVFQTQAKRDEFQKVIPTYNLSATFSDRMYFWPISHSELKRNKKLTQNPGWTYND
ncbi:RagB/SusD family nutrient uptake outer membrane protein [Hoylesella oralis]|uniref:RagB/SusD family nutrient uptake outer membrane protein n=1 Tax=Hoylesella oralis TaxID=28134 RepID=UPI0028E36EE6|nr:RagB/SusD family nutrient uptake outer membrane protein [Hoylesella oralis]